MGYWASATLTYGYDVTGQSPDWLDNDDMDDPCEYGGRILAVANPDTLIRLAWDSHAKHQVLAAVWKHAYSEGSTIESLELPADVKAQLDWAAEVLGFNVAGQTPGWLMSAKFD